MIQCHFNKYLQKLREKGLARKNLAKQGTPVSHSNHDKLDAKINVGHFQT